MTEVGIIWSALTYSPGSQIDGRIVVRDAHGQAPQSIRWWIEYNSAATNISGATPSVSVPCAQPGVYKACLSVVDSAGVTAYGESLVTVGSPDQQVKASLLPVAQDGTFVLMARLFARHKVYRQSQASEAPVTVFSDGDDIYLVPGTTHVTFDLDPDANSAEDDVVVRTRYGNWALRGGSALNGTQKIGYDYRIDNPFIPAPADLHLRLTMDVIRLSAGTVAPGSFRVRVNCWRLVAPLYQYEQCSYSIHPGGAGLRQRRFALLFTNAEVQTDYLSPSENRLSATSEPVVYTAPNVTTIPTTALTATGAPYPVNQGTGISYTEANRYAIYESSDANDLDLKAVAALENVRPFAVWINREGTPQVLQRLKRLYGEMVVYVNNGPVLEGSFITVRVETGISTVIKTLPVTQTVYSDDPLLFVRVGSVSFDTSDFQFGQTGVSAFFSVNEALAVTSSGTVASESVPAWGPVVLATGTVAPSIHFDGACYINPVRLPFTDTEQVAIVATIPGCHASVCGPVGLYCYDDGAPDEPSVTVMATDTAAFEPDAPGVFTFYRTGSTDSGLTVDFVVTGSATSGVDYVSLGTSVTFAPGSATATKLVTPLDDADIESDETVTVTLVPGTGYAVGSPQEATVLIVSDDLPVVTVQATDSAASETGPDTGTFTFYRTGPTTATLNVTFTVGGTAVSGTDYTPLVLSVTFGIGQATATRTVTPINDVNVEPVETVIATVSAGAGYTVGSPSAATIDISSDDVIPTVTVQATDSTATEAGSTTGTFTFYRTGSTAGSLVVNFAVTGTATAVTDYASLGTSVTFNPGFATATKTVTPVDDADIEGDETVIVTITADPSYAIGTPGSATVTITSDDVAPSATLTVSMDGGEDVDAWVYDTTVVNKTGYELTSYGAALDGFPEYVYAYVDSSNGDQDPFVHSDPVYRGMMDDVLQRGRTVELLNMGFDGFTSPTWVFANQGGVSTWPHTFWVDPDTRNPGDGYQSNPVEVFGSGWNAVVYGFLKSEYPNVIPGRYGTDQLTASGNVVVPGTIGVLYSASVRVRGVIQRSQYTGGSNNGAYLQTGGAIADQWQDYAKITVSDPAAVYFVNRGATKTAYNVPLDYTVNIPAKGGATITLEIGNQDGFQYRAGSDGQPVPLTGFAASENIWVRLDITV